MSNNKMNSSKIKNKLFINNEYILPKNNLFFDNTNPANENFICQIPQSSIEDIELAVQAAHKAFNGPWKNFTPFEKGQLLFKFSDIIEKNAEYLSFLESLDVGKPKSEAEGDINGVINCFRYNAGAADKIEGATNSIRF